MSVAHLGKAVEELCTSAVHELLLVAPFIKEPVLSHLLSRVGSDEVEVTCVTRWHPHEIAAGVSDLSVWRHFRHLPRRRLFLRQDLHAKYYRCDGECLVGSANITAAAFGYSATPNLELLVPARLGDSGLEMFEERLFLGAIEVDDRVFSDVSCLVEKFDGAAKPPINATSFVESLSADLGPVEDLATWTPLLRRPEDLYLVYSQDADDLSKAEIDAATRDLAVLRVVPGLDKPDFEAMVGHALLLTPIVQRLDRFVYKSRRFGEVRDFLAAFEINERRWQTLLRWLNYYLEDRYSYTRPHFTEVICRKNLNL